MKIAAALLMLSLAATSALALDAGPDDVYARVVDVGPGLCVVIKIPGGRCAQGLQGGSNVR
jgi:hypothetical protein